MATVIVKPTDACNARCVYCSAASSKEKGRMSLATAERMFLVFRDLALARGEREVNFIWHGGEPLLMPDRFCEGVVSLQKRILGGAGLTWRNGIQTNLTLMSERRIPTLKRLLGADGCVGTSADPIPGIRVLGRDSPRSYMVRWRASVRLLEEHGIKYGVVYVVHRLSLPRLADVYRHFRSEHPRAPVRFNPLYLQGRARGCDSISITPADWGKALNLLFSLWREDGEPGDIHPLSAWAALRRREVSRGSAVTVRQGTSGRRGASGRRIRCRLACDVSGRCAETHWGVAPDGSIHSCGRSIDGGVFRYGNVHTTPADELLATPVRQALANRIVYLRQGSCRGCRWWRYCHGGCPNDGLLSRGTPFSPTGWCEGLKRFFETSLRSYPGAKACVA